VRVWEYDANNLVDRGRVMIEPGGNDGFDSNSNVWFSRMPSSRQVRILLGLPEFRCH